MVGATHEDDDEDAKYLCWRCVGEAYLRDEIKRTGRARPCSYCSRRGRTLSIDNIADHVDRAFEDHYELTADQPSGLQYAMQREGDYEWEREGEPALWAIANAAEIEEAPAADILSNLADRYYSRSSAEIGESTPFDDDSYYEEKGADDVEFQQMWRHFEATLQTQARYFNKTAGNILDQVFGDLTHHVQRDGSSVIVEAGPDQGLKALYRGRVFQSSGSLEEAIGRPDLYLGPPPFRRATAGRMNPHGIGVFYGATAVDTVLGEVRPPVGSDVAVARFKLLRPLRLLDVEALKKIFVKGSVFDPDYRRRCERARFLERVAWRIAMAVTPDDEPLDYLITQVIADYLSNAATPQLDGIIYPSVQADGAGANVVLFHKAARVTPIDLPKGTTIEASSYINDEDDDDLSYTVWEEEPEDEEKPPELNPNEWPTVTFVGNFEAQRDCDERPATLSVELETVTVHSVRAVKVTTRDYEVRRYRSKRGEKTPF